MCTQMVTSSAAFGVSWFPTGSPVNAMYGMYDGNNTFYVENDGLTYGDHINDVITIYYSYGNFIFL